MSLEPEIPGYNIEKRLGRGGMATVYLALQDALNRNVALKVMSSQLGEDSVWAKRFIQEAQVIAQLTHPNIVPVYDVGTHEGQFYISMEYLSGGSLKSKMSKGIPIPEVLKIIVGVAAGLDFAGEKGFVHRDIKPDNIMFREDGAPVILDFGIVKQIDAGPNKMTQTGVIVGTTSYMSPEQAQGRELDQRSDIYGLGVMFFELLTGKPPFKGETDVATLLMHINDPVPRLVEPLAAFQPIINKALAKDPFHRYTRAREMIDHIQELEPNIKAALAKIKVGNASDPTQVKTAVSDQDDDATMVVTTETTTGGTTAITQQVTTEEELTQVLSSAKATIRDFSAESRERKARRTKSVIAAVSLVAAVAIGYVGYQQLVVVPQERALADAKIREAEQKSQRKIDELLEEAKVARVGLLPTELDKMDNVIAIYRQVLKLDPDNKESEFVLEKFGDRYIEMAKNAVRRRDIGKAATYRDYAEQLVPTSPELPGLRNVIKALRAEELDREFVREEVETLLSVAKADLETSESFSDPAYTKLQQVLRIDPDNAEANRLVDNMLETLYQTTETNIARGRVSAARSDLAILEKYYDDPVKVANLDAKLKSTSSALAKKQQINSLLAKAERLQREKRTLAVNDDMRKLYLSVLEVDPLNEKAGAGLDDASAFDAKIAQEAIEEREFDRAEKQIRLIENTSPQYRGLAALKNSLSGARNAVSQANQMLVEAQRLISTGQTGVEKRRELLNASGKIRDAETVDANNPDIEQALVALESEYVATIKQLINEKNKTLAEAYFKDAQSRDWPSDRIFELQQLAQKSEKKPKRVITGGF